MGLISFRTIMLKFHTMPGYFLEIWLMLLMNFDTVKHLVGTGGGGCIRAIILIILLHRKMVVPMNFIKPEVLERKRKFTHKSVFMSSSERKFKYKVNVFCRNRI